MDFFAFDVFDLSIVVADGGQFLFESVDESAAKTMVEELSISAQIVLVVRCLRINFMSETLT